MFTEEIFYGIRCDRCGEQYESSGDYSYMTDKSEILEAAENDDWQEIDGKHYCPDCYVKDPEPIDDDHEYMPKVDLEKELETLDSLLYDLDGVAVKGTTSYLTIEDVKDIAKHFFELGLKAKENNYGC